MATLPNVAKFFYIPFCKTAVFPKPLGIFEFRKKHDIRNFLKHLNMKFQFTKLTYNPRGSKGPLSFQKAPSGQNPDRFSKAPLDFFCFILLKTYINQQEDV